MPELRAFPSSFVLKNICSIASRGFELKPANPHISHINKNVRSWFKRFNAFNDESKTKVFLTLGQLDLYTALSFPDADAKHLETCFMFTLWALSTDDISDEGDLKAKPESVQASLDISMQMLKNLDGPVPKNPSAAMLHDLLKRIKDTATPGNYNRFIRAFEDWSKSTVMQAFNRRTDCLPSMAEFLALRRNTTGVAMIEAIIEYSLDINLPDCVFHHPTMIAMSQAVNDIITWPNDLCSFNKEQAEGDLQNLVCCVMMEHDIELQEAVDVITRMIEDRVTDYLELKSHLPSFGQQVDSELSRYLNALENSVQGTIVWYYKSPRYFRGLDVTSMEEAVINLFPKFGVSF